MEGALRGPEGPRRDVGALSESRDSIRSCSLGFMVGQEETCLLRLSSLDVVVGTTVSARSIDETQRPTADPC